MNAYCHSVSSVAKQGFESKLSRDINLHSDDDSSTLTLSSYYSREAAGLCSSYGMQVFMMGKKCMF